MLTSSLSFNLFASVLRIIFCFSNSSRLSDPLFYDYRSFILSSYSSITFFCSVKAFWRGWIPPWIIWELNAFIFSSSFLFSSLYLKNYFDRCWRAFITLFLSSYIFLFSASNCSNCTNLVLSITTLFFYSNSDRNFFS